MQWQIQVFEKGGILESDAENGGMAVSQKLTCFVYTIAKVAVSFAQAPYMFLISFILA